ncbi:MAG TPA: phospholipase D-like domain-containing protein, partial [Gemmatimonadaceae bacterium]
EHACAVDGARVFIGSYNFDPRSAQLNTEIGVVIDSPTMAQVMADVFASRIPTRAYRVRIAASGALEWVEQTDAGEVVHSREPHATWWRRVVVWVMSVLPIEWLL